MSLEKGQISDYGVMMLMTGFIFGSSLIIPPAEAVLGHDAWIAVLLGTAGGMLLAMGYTALVNRFPGRTLVEIAEAVYGRRLGRLVAAAFLWYLFHLGSLVLGNFTTYFSTLFLPRTPEVVLLLLLVLVCASAAGRGVEVLACCSQVITPLTLCTLVLDTMLLVGNYRPERLLPLLEAPPRALLRASLAAASFPFAEIVAFLMVLPFINSSRAIRTSTFKSLAVAGLSLAMIALRNAMVLGSTMQSFIYSSFKAVTMINIAEITRLEIVVAVIILAVGFLKVAVLLYGTSLGAAQALGLRSYRHLVFPLGILMIVAALFNFACTPDMIEFASKIYPIYAFPFQVGIPLVTLAVAAIRRLPRKERGV